MGLDYTDELRTRLSETIRQERDRAEAAEVRAEQLETELDLANAHAKRLMDERDEARRQLEQAQAELSVAQDALRYIIQTDDRKFMKHTFREISKKAKDALLLNEIKP